MSDIQMSDIQMSDIQMSDIITDAREVIAEKPVSKKNKLNLARNLQEIRPQFSPEDFETLCYTLARDEDEDEDVREALAVNEALSAAAQKILARDDDRSVRRSLARNKALSEALQEILAWDKNEDVREALARNKALRSEAAQERLAWDKNEDVRQALAGNEALKNEALQEILARSEDWLVRRALAGNSSLSAALQERLARDKNLFVREALAGNEALSEAAQEILARDNDPYVCRVLARHPALSEAAQEILARDNDPYVCRALAGNENLGMRAQKILLMRISALAHEFNNRSSDNAVVNMAAKLAGVSGDKLSDKKILRWGFILSAKSPDTGRRTLVTIFDGVVTCMTGSFKGTVEGFRAAIEETHSDENSDSRKHYNQVLSDIDTWRAQKENSPSLVDIASPV